MSPEAQRAAQYMAEHNWLRDGVAWEQVAAVIDRYSDRVPAKAFHEAMQRGKDALAANLKFNDERNRAFLGDDWLKKIS